MTKGKKHRHEELESEAPLADARPEHDPEAAGDADAEVDDDESGEAGAHAIARVRKLTTIAVAKKVAVAARLAGNLRGAERYALLCGKGEGNECEVALSQDLEHDPGNLFGGRTYAGGDPAVDATLSDGVLRIGPIEGSEALAVVPRDPVRTSDVYGRWIQYLADHLR